ncbi:MAG: rhamnulokinase family protein [Pseudarthrobacter sp.]
MSTTGPAGDTVPSPAGAKSAAGVFAAVDIGASSGRVILGRVNDGSASGSKPTVELEIIHRFPNGVVEFAGGLHWDFDFLFGAVLEGLSLTAKVAAARRETITSIGIDTWAVDYGLVNTAGQLVAPPFSYRDGRSRAAIARVHQKLDPATLYRTTGLQFLQFNTIYQLATEKNLEGLQALLIPDLIAFMLTGQRRTEATNASTTGLFDAGAGEWATEFFTALDLRQDLFPQLIQPGDTVGGLLPHIAEQLRLPQDTKVVAVGSHDTASAVVAVPARDGNFAYISSGTWSLVGLELKHPVLTEASRQANFTNERGVDGTIRYLRNMGGLWLLSECQRAWAQEGFTPELEDLLEAAAGLPPGGPLINADDPGFIAPGNMPDRIRSAVLNAGSDLSGGPAATVRCILDSLAAGYARTISDAERLAGYSVDDIHIVGGGSQNGLLSQLTANATGKRVFAGPVEATALGNILIQARSANRVMGTLTDLRRLLATAQDTAMTYLPATLIRPRESH